MENFGSFLALLQKVLLCLFGKVNELAVVKVLADQENCLTHHVGQGHLRMKNYASLTH